jgi:OmpA-OmpF porin, OOP family
MKRLGIALGLALVAGTACAQEQGFYLGASVGGTSANACDLADFSNSCDADTTNLKVFAGYQINRNFAVEAGYINTLAKATVSSTSGQFLSPATPSTADLAARAIDLLLVPSLPLGERASVYGKLGVYFANTKSNSTSGQPPVTTHSDESNTGLTYGLGFAWSFTRNITARADWQRFNSVGGGQMSDVHVDMLHIGALYRF